MLRQRSLEPPPAVHISRGKAGEFAMHARINGVKAPMVIDTGATSVVLTWETAKSIGLPIDMLEYNVDVETAGGHTKAARLTLDRLSSASWSSTRYRRWWCRAARSRPTCSA